MPKREYRERHRKRTKYSSDSSEDERRESSSRRYREKSRSKRTSEKKSSYRSSRQRDSSDASSSDSRRTSSTSSSSSSSSNSRSNSASKSSKNSKQPLPSKEDKQFELDDLYKNKDKAKILNEIESDSFNQASFSQSKKIVVDLAKDQILVPSSVPPVQEESLIHPNFLGDDQKRMDKWIKKLHIYRNQ